jgi:hypothetical protein
MLFVRSDGANRQAQEYLRPFLRVMCGDCATNTRRLALNRAKFRAHFGSAPRFEYTNTAVRLPLSIYEELYVN